MGREGQSPNKRFLIISVWFWFQKREKKEREKPEIRGHPEIY